MNMHQKILQKTKIQVTEESCIRVKRGRLDNMVNESEEATIDQSVDNEASEDNTIEGKASSIQVKPLFNTVISFDNLALDESEALDFELALHLKPRHLKKSWRQHIGDNS